MNKGFYLINMYGQYMVNDRQPSAYKQLMLWINKTPEDFQKLGLFIHVYSACGEINNSVLLAV